MPDSESTGLTILAAGLVGVVAVLSSRVSERLRIPAPVEAGLAAPGDGTGPYRPRSGFSVLGRPEVAGRSVVLLEAHPGPAIQRASLCSSRCSAQREAA